jgi:hypothetical protein
MAHKLIRIPASVPLALIEEAVQNHLKESGAAEAFATEVIGVFAKKFPDVAITDTEKLNDDKCVTLVSKSIKGLENSPLIVAKITPTKFLGMLLQKTSETGAFKTWNADSLEQLADKVAEDFKPVTEGVVAESAEFDLKKKADEIKSVIGALELYIEKLGNKKLSRAEIEAFSDCVNNSRAGVSNAISVIQGALTGKSVKEAVSVDREYITKRLKEYNRGILTFERLLDGIVVDLDIKSNADSIEQLKKHLEASEDGNRIITTADEILDLNLPR